MTDRRHARILAMQALCQLEVLGPDMLAQLDEFLADDGADDAVRDYARALVLFAWEHQGPIDEHIQKSTERWDVKRMSAVDRNVLRVAVAELEHCPDVPPPVVLNEAIEIGKEFGTADSGGFINGVLDAVLKSTTPGEPATDNPQLETHSS